MIESDFMDMEVKYGQVDEFRPFDDDLKKTSSEGYEILKENIKMNGIVEPLKVVINPFGNKLVWDGEKRLEIAKDLGIEKVPYIKYGDWENRGGDFSTEDVKELIVVSSQRTGEIDKETVYGEWARRIKQGDSYEEVASKLGIPQENDKDSIKHTVTGYREKHERSGKKVDDEIKEKVDMFDWGLISELPEDDKVELIKKRAKEEIDRSELAKKVERS